MADVEMEFDRDIEEGSDEGISESDSNDIPNPFAQSKFLQSFHCRLFHSLQLYTHRYNIASIRMVSKRRIIADSQTKDISNTRAKSRRGYSLPYSYRKVSREMRAVNVPWVKRKRKDKNVLDAILN